MWTGDDAAAISGSLVDLVSQHEKSKQQEILNQLAAEKQKREQARQDLDMQIKLAEFQQKNKDAADKDRKEQEAQRKEEVVSGLGEARQASLNAKAGDHDGTNPMAAQATRDTLNVLLRKNGAGDIADKNIETDRKAQEQTDKGSAITEYLNTEPDSLARTVLGNNLQMKFGVTPPAPPKPETNPIISVDPTKGTMKTIGDAPAGAHIVNVPKPAAVPGAGLSGVSPEGEKYVGNTGMTKDDINYYGTMERLSPGAGIRALSRSQSTDPARRAIMHEAVMQAKMLNNTPTAVFQQQMMTKSDQKSLDKVTAAQGMVEGFEKKAVEQAGYVRDYSAAVPRTDYPILNKWILEGKMHVLGDTPTALLFNSITTFSTEYAKIMEGSTGSAAGSTEGARKASERLINAYQKTGTIDAVLDLMEKEMGSSVRGFETVKKTINNRVSARGEGGIDGNNATGGTNPNDAPKPMTRTLRNPRTNQTMTQTSTDGGQTWK